MALFCTRRRRDGALKRHYANTVNTIYEQRVAELELVSRSGTDFLMGVDCVDANYHVEKP